MRILLKEAFDSSMPGFVRDWMNQRSGRYSSNTYRAGTFSTVDASAAKFTDVSSESVNDLRKRIKNGEILFAYVKSPNSWSDSRYTIAIWWDSISNSIQVQGNGTENFKEYSFKKYIENSSEIYSTPGNTDVSAKRKERRDARKGMISRDGDSAHDDFRRFSFNGEDWKKDASGYWHDANRLSRKLAQLHAEDIGYYYQKASEIFVNMANSFADTVKTMAQNPESLSFDSFGDSSFERITREGQRLLRDVGEKMNYIKREVDNYFDSLEDANNARASAGREPWDEAALKDHQEYVLGNIQRYFAEIQQKKRELLEIQ